MGRLAAEQSPQTSPPPPPEWGIPSDWKGIPIKRVLIYTLWFIRSPWQTVEKVNARLRLPKRLKDIIRETCQLWAGLAQPYGFYTQPDHYLAG